MDAGPEPQPQTAYPSSRKLQLGLRLTFAAFLLRLLAGLAAEAYLTPWYELRALGDRIGAARYAAFEVAFANDLINGGGLLLAAVGLWWLARTPKATRNRWPARIAMAALVVNASMILAHPVLRSAGPEQEATVRIVGNVLYQLEPAVILVWIAALLVALQRQLRHWQAPLRPWALRAVVAGALWNILAPYVWRFFLWRLLIQRLPLWAAHWSELVLGALAELTLLWLLLHAARIDTARLATRVAEVFADDKVTNRTAA